MSYLKQIKIFLASPSDVNIERGYVEKVVERVNKTVASHHAVILKLISSKDARPDYGKDGQAILNEQIANMEDYDLFIGIMWKRIGKQTARSISGTVEEFERAEGAFKQKGRPKIWFYFSQRPPNLKTVEEKKQRNKVLSFRKEIEGKGLCKYYKKPIDFREQLHDHLITWLNDREVNKTQTPPNLKNSSKPRIVSVTSPGNWLKLNDQFYKTDLAPFTRDGNIVAQISPTNKKHIAELQYLESTNIYGRNIVIYKDRSGIKIEEVLSVDSKSEGKKTIFHLNLSPYQPLYSRWVSRRVGYSTHNHNDNEIAELHARLILLGEPLPNDIGYSSIEIAHRGWNHDIETISEGIFPKLWKEQKLKREYFLPRAWLTAAYYLKMNQIVERIIKLHLKVDDKKIMTVHFQGQRSSNYSGKEGYIIKIQGKCSLS